MYLIIVDTACKKIHFVLLDKINLLGYYLHLWLLTNNVNGKYFLVDKKGMNEAYSDPIPFVSNNNHGYPIRVSVNRNLPLKSDSS